GEIEGCCTSGGEGDCPQPGLDDPLVLHLPPQQCHGSTVSCGDGSPVQHRSGYTVRIPASKLVVTGHEVGRSDVQCGCDQRAYVNVGILAKQDAIRVHQKDLTIGLQLAQDLARILTQDSVQCHRVGCGLHEPDGISGANIELLPIYGQAWAGLLHGQCAVLRCTDSPG